MSGVTASSVQDLRQRTGAGMMDCKKALVESKGDVEKAIEYLRKKGLSAAAKKAGRETKQGSVVSYVHGGGRIGVLVEISCETDFVARNEEFQNFAKDVAMHVAASNPQFLTREEVPAEFLDKERSIIAEQLKQEGKPENMIEKITEGKIGKCYKEVCLMEQSFVKNPDQTIETYLKENIAKLGENMIIKRFVRFELGQ